MINSSMKVMVASVIALGGCTVAKDKPNEAQRDITWWTLVNQQYNLIPDGLEKIKSTFEMRVDKTTGTRYRVNWIGRGVSLQDGIDVSNSGLSVAVKSQRSDLIVFSLYFDGRCIPFDEVKQHYPDIGMPLPSSPHDKIVSTTWSLAKERAIIYFEMEKMDGSECLRRVAFGPKNK